MKSLDHSPDHVSTTGSTGTKGSSIEWKHNKITTPQPTDVILGRGKSYGKHPGNVIFQDLVQSNRLRYFESSFSVKRAIIAGVMDAIQGKGGKFVQMKANAWSIAPDENVRLKIAHAIQYHIRAELSQTSNVLPSKVDDDVSVSQQEVSDHDRLVKKLREKISILQNQIEPSALPRNVSGASIVTPVGARQNRQVSSSVDTIAGKQATTKPYNSNVNGSTNEMQHVSTKTSHHVSGNEDQAYPGQAFPSLANMNHLSRCNSNQHPRRIMPPMKPVAETDFSRLRQFKHPSNPAHNRRTAIESFASNVIDQMQLQQERTPFMNLFIEQAIADYIDFTDSSEYKYYLRSKLCNQDSDDMLFDDTTGRAHQSIPYLHDIPKHPHNSFQTRFETFHKSNGMFSSPYSGNHDDASTMENMSDQIHQDNCITDCESASTPSFPSSSSPQQPSSDQAFQSLSDWFRGVDTDDDLASQWDAEDHMFQSFHEP